MSLLDKVKGSLGFDDGDWEEEYDGGTFDHDEDSGLVVRKRANRESGWGDSSRDDYDEYDEEDEYGDDEFEDPREDEPSEDTLRAHDRDHRNVKLTSRPGYAGYSPGDTPAKFDEGDGRAATPRRSSVPHRSRGTVTGREVTTGLDQHRSASRSNLHVSTPRSFADAEIIGNHFKSGHPVLIDVSMVTKAVAQRVLDFAFGLTYGREGSIDRINDKAFMLTPRGEALSRDDRQRLVELGYTGESPARGEGGARESL